MELHSPPAECLELQLSSADTRAEVDPMLMQLNCVTINNPGPYSCT